MDDKLFQVILTFLPVIGSIVTYFMIPWLKANMDKEKLAQCEKWASLAVKGAEMIFSTKGAGTDKKAYAAAFLNDIFNKKKVVITENQLEVLIESAVQELNRNKE